MTGGGDAAVDEAFWAQVVEDTGGRFCARARVDEVRQLLDDVGLAGRFDVQEAGWVEDNRLLLIDHHAFEAYVRQSRQHRPPVGEEGRGSGASC